MSAIGVMSCSRKTPERLLSFCHTAKSKRCAIASNSFLVECDQEKGVQARGDAQRTCATLLRPNAEAESLASDQFGPGSERAE